jgi:hypothetical protein
MVGVFGANADAEGVATTTGSKIDVQFSSATGGIGQLAGLPVLVVSVPVLAAASGMVTISATSPDSSVTVANGSVAVQGTLSVQKIYAGKYAGSAPESVAGLLQVNAVVPAGVSVGSAVPVAVSVGGVASQAGVTLAVR